MQHAFKENPVRLVADDAFKIMAGLGINTVRDDRIRIAYCAVERKRTALLTRVGLLRRFQQLRVMSWCNIPARRPGSWKMTLVSAGRRQVRFAIRSRRTRTTLYINSYENQMVPVPVQRCIVLCYFSIVMTYANA